MITKPIKTRIFKEGESLNDFISNYFKKIYENSIIVITSKIVALSENRTAEKIDVTTKENLIKSESEIAIPTKYAWMTLKDGMIMASAGIDESNADGKLILLPKNSFEAARIIRKNLKTKFGVKNLGVLITDSRTLPFRSGVIGAAMGYAGFRGIKDYTKKKDIFGRKFKFSRVNVADSLATAAVFVMGEGDERQPLAIIKNADVEFCEKVRKGELNIDVTDDMYSPIISELAKNKE
jgi:coenzyme F420-0:L-glutamate ligase